MAIGELAHRALRSEDGNKIGPHNEQDTIGFVRKRWLSMDRHLIVISAHGLVHLEAWLTPTSWANGRRSTAPPR